MGGIRWAEMPNIILKQKDRGCAILINKHAPKEGDGGA